MCRLSKFRLTRTTMISFQRNKLRLFCLVIFLGFFSLILQFYSNSDTMVTLRIWDTSMPHKIVAVSSNSTASVTRSFNQERYLRVAVADNVKNHWKHNMTGRGLKARGKVVPDTDNMKDGLKRDEPGTGLEPWGKGMHDTGNVNTGLRYNQTSLDLEARNKVMSDLDNLQSDLKYFKTGRDAEAWRKIPKLQNELNSDYENGRGLEAWNKRDSGIENVEKNLKYYDSGGGLEAWGKVMSDIENIKNHLKYFDTGRGLEAWGRVMSDTENVKNQPMYFENGRHIEPQGKVVSDIENVKNNPKFYENDRGPGQRGKVVSDSENIKKSHKFYKNARGQEPWAKVMSDTENEKKNPKSYQNDSYRDLEQRGKVMSHIENRRDSQKFYRNGRELDPRGNVMSDFENIKRDSKFHKNDRGPEPRGNVMSDFENIENSQKFHKNGRELEPRGKVMSDFENIKRDPKYYEKGRDPKTWGTELHDAGRTEKDLNPNQTGRGLEAWGKMVWPRAAVTAPWNRRNNTSTPLCPLFPTGLYGYMPPDIQAPKWTDIIRLNPRLEPGGHYQPAACKARHRVAIIVPYRNREEHLRMLLHNLHPMLQRQQLDYFILVVELAQPTKFNRGMLLNIGAVEALGLWDVQCFIFHDVDLLPENDHNLYTCPETPRHMSAAVDKFQYRLPYKTIFGGVGALRVKDFYRLNGYSNMYFGWGGEDDDFSGRITNVGLSISRYRMEIARYQMIKHKRDKTNGINHLRFLMLRSIERRQPTDGLNTLQYQVQKVEFRPGYTWILVSVDQDQVLDKAWKSQWRKQLQARRPPPRNSAFRRQPVIPPAIRRESSWPRVLRP